MDWIHPTPPMVPIRLVFQQQPDGVPAAAMFIMGVTVWIQHGYITKQVDVSQTCCWVTIRLTSISLSIN